MRDKEQTGIRNRSSEELFSDTPTENPNISENINKRMIVIGFVFNVLTANFAGIFFEDNKLLKNIHQVHFVFFQDYSFQCKTSLR